MERLNEAERKAVLAHCRKALNEYAGGLVDRYTLAEKKVAELERALQDQKNTCEEYAQQLLKDELEAEIARLRPIVSQVEVLANRCKLAEKKVIELERALQHQKSSSEESARLLEEEKRKTDHANASMRAEIDFDNTLLRKLSGRLEHDKETLRLDESIIARLDEEVQCEKDKRKELDKLLEGEKQKTANLESKLAVAEAEALAWQTQAQTQSQDKEGIKLCIEASCDRLLQHKSQSQDDLARQLENLMALVSDGLATIPKYKTDNDSVESLGTLIADSFTKLSDEMKAGFELLSQTQTAEKPTGDDGSNQLETFMKDSLAKMTYDIQAL
jgi:chromosome segregation ATPase